MVHRIHVSSYEEFKASADKYQDKVVFALFTGSVDESTGKSWCPDCVAADPVIEEGMKTAHKDAIFIICKIDRPLWKDMDNIFRTSEMRIRSLPTLWQVDTPQRLEEVQCKDIEMVKMLVSEEDD